MSVADDERDPSPLDSPATGLEEESSMDGVLLEEGYDEASADSHAGAGLKLDDAQAAEIRDVFLITLPQYLEPVGQMVDQIVSAPETAESTRDALDTTLESIADAATRVGVGDVASHIERMRECLVELDAGVRARDDVASDLADELAQLQRLVVGDESAPGREAEGSERGGQTLFAALEGVEGMDRDVLEKLTAAGVVYVEQLEVARADELVAVSGLDPDVVRRLLDVIGGRPDAAPEGEIDRERFRKEVLEAAAGSEDAELTARILDRVEREVDVEELRVAVLRLREQASSLRSALTAAEHEREVLELSLTRARGQLAEELVSLGDARADQQRLERSLLDHEAALESTSRRLSELQTQGERVEQLEVERRQRLSELQEVVSRLLDATPGRLRPAKNTNEGGDRVPPESV